MAKIKGIPYFVTDEKELQAIVDTILNIGLDDIRCIRIRNVIEYIRDGKINNFKRKEAKAMWRLSGKTNEEFDNEIWVLEK